jgi:uncharacterized protein (UPF0276 family)
MRNNKIKLAVPKSDLFDKNTERLLPYAEVIEFRNVDFFPKDGHEFIFHSGENLLDPLLKNKLTRPFFAFLQQYNVSCFSLDLGPAFEKVKIVAQKYIACSPIMDKTKIEGVADDNLGYIRKHFDGEIAVENLNYYDTGAYEIVCRPDYICDFVNKKQIKFLLDLAHAKVSAYNLGIEFSEYLKSLPLNKAIEIHLSRAVISGREMIDAHEAMREEDFFEFQRIKVMTKPKYLVIEYYKDIGQLEENYDQLKRIIDVN